MGPDRLAAYFVPWEWRVLHEAARLARFAGMQPKLRGTEWYVHARTRFLDRVVRNSDAKQIVVMAAGFDTRAYRGVARPGTSFYEVDIATTQSEKLAVVRANPDEFPTEHVKFVAVDFAAGESFVDKLVQSGFDPEDIKTVVLIEGLVYYLDEAAVENMMRKISSSFAPGTYVALDVMDADWESDDDAKSRARRLASYLAKIGEPLKFGIRSFQGETIRTKFEPWGFDVVYQGGLEDMPSTFLFPDGRSWAGELEPFAIQSSFVVLRVKG